MVLVLGHEKRRYFPPPFIHTPTPTDDAHTVCNMRHFSSSFGGDVRIIPPLSYRTSVRPRL